MMNTQRSNDEKLFSTINGILEAATVPASNKIRMLDRLISRLADSPDVCQDIEALRKAARAAGRLAKDPIEEEGGTLSSAEVGKIVGVSRATINQWRQLGKILAIPKSRATYRYPAFQLSRAKVLGGIAESLALLSKLPGVTERAKALYLLSPFNSADGETQRAIDLLREGNKREAILLLESNVFF